MPDGGEHAARFVASGRPLPQEKLCVLLVNWSLQARGGTESVVRDIALGPRSRDHRPLVYAPSLGATAQEIAAAGIPVVDDLARIGDVPDIIHAHHFLTTGETLIRFPRTPAIQLCHGWSPPPERPVRFPKSGMGSLSLPHPALGLCFPACFAPPVIPPPAITL